MPSAAAVARQPTADELAELLALLAKEQRHFEAPGAKPWALAADDPAHPPELPKERDAGPARRLDGRGARAAEPGRNHHQGVVTP